MPRSGNVAGHLFLLVGLSTSYPLFMVNLFDDGNFFQVSSRRRGHAPQPAIVAGVWNFHIPPRVIQISVPPYNLKLLTAVKYRNSVGAASGFGAAVSARDCDRCRWEIC